MLINKLKNNYTKIPNALITDLELSNGAKVVYCYIASKPSGWNVFNADIMKALGIKKENTLAKYWKELIEAGWITRTKNNVSSDNKTGTYTYVIYGEAQDVNLQTYQNGIYTKKGGYQNGIYTKKGGHSNTKPISNKESNQEEATKKAGSRLSDLDYRLLLTKLREKAIYKSKVKDDQELYEAYSALSDKRSLLDDYLLHQKEEGKYSRTFLNFVLDYTAIKEEKKEEVVYFG